jgi:ribose 5-phosphate isomerase B
MTQWLDEPIAQCGNRYLRHWVLSGRILEGTGENTASSPDEFQGRNGVEKMKIALAADHAGFALKEKIREYLKSKGLEVEDRGPSNTEPVDYPDFAEKVAVQVAAKQADYGVLVCGTGIGMMIAANKVPGIRAAAANDTISARLAREHNNANILTMGGWMIDEAAMHQIVDTWLSTPFACGHHERRVEEIEAIDQRYHAEKRA